MTDPQNSAENDRVDNYTGENMPTAENIPGLSENGGAPVCCCDAFRSILSFCSKSNLKNICSILSCWPSVDVQKMYFYLVGRQNMD
jgi:hypothetical protein